ncbi:MAG: nitroreductase [Bacillota bacterium]|nr:nitroreductase [Bacillota bacterium]
MADTYETILSRRSCHRFKADPIPEESLTRVLTAGTYAPCGMGKQSPIIVVFTGEKRDALSKLNRSFFPRAVPESFDPFYGAPVVAVVLARKDVGTYIYDGSLVMANMLLEAEDEGLGGIWIHRAKECFSSDKGRKMLADLGIDPDLYEGIGNCCLGYWGVDKQKPAPRKENWIYFAD